MLQVCVKGAKTLGAKSVTLCDGSPVFSQHQHHCNLTGRCYIEIDYLSKVVFSILARYESCQTKQYKAVT